MSYSATLRQNRFVFEDLRELFARANEEKSGDQLAGVAARSETERIAAKIALANVTLGEIADNPLLDPEKDDVSRILLKDQNQSAFQELRSLTVGEFREMLLDRDNLDEIPRAILPEHAAAVAKLMSNKDLVVAANKLRVITSCRNTLGERGVFGIRLQPNHPADDITGIVLSTLDGLLFGCGDAVIGVNPATESVEVVGAILRALADVVDRLEIPTQTCCLAHVTTQLEAMKQGAPVDLLFQSIAGTQAANASFGVSLDLLQEGREQVLERRKSRSVKWVGNQVMYFETGQGSALSAGAHHGIDQMTQEARAYGVARHFDPFLVNSVVGFIGPEYLCDERQITRAGLEDHFMGKLLGLPMGVDVCYTNHAAADQNSADNLLLLLALAGVNYVMGVPCADDVMLNYQSTSFHDAVAIRELLGLKPAPEFAAWLERIGLTRAGRLQRQDGPRNQLLTELGYVA
ncbi:MAG: ethanolamine ammonia-lyase subunit EutB [Gemmataceae bacterium]